MILTVTLNPALDVTYTVDRIRVGGSHRVRSMTTRAGLGDRAGCRAACRMILTVTLNPALDVTYTVDRIRVGGSHRVRSMTTRAGGKGVNVASVLTSLGYPAIATGVVCGSAGARIRDDLDARGVRHDFATGAGESRSTVNVVDSSTGEATIFNEPGPQLNATEWQDLVAHLDRLLDRLLDRAGVTVLVASGSLPPGLAETAYRDVVALGHEHGVWTVLDAEGPALLAALESRPGLVKPNRDGSSARPGSPTSPARRGTCLEAGPALSSSRSGRRVPSSSEARCTSGDDHRSRSRATRPGRVTPWSPPWRQHASTGSTRSRACAGRSAGPRLPSSPQRPARSLRTLPLPWPRECVWRRPHDPAPTRDSRYYRCLTAPSNTSNRGGGRWGSPGGGRMTLCTLVDVLGPARAEGRAVGAFNVVQVEHAEAFVGAAEDAGLPVVLQISQNAVRYHGALAPIAAATRAVAEVAAVPCVLHLDHADDLDLVHEALGLGFTSVMYDGSRLDDAANRSTTAEMAHVCHRVGASIEAELGEVGGKDGVHAPGARTDPDAAVEFVADTGVDALAVAVGSSHAMATRTAQLDHDLTARLAQAVPVPLVLHGSSGVPDDEIVTAVRAGMVKVNIATHLNRVLTDALRAHLDAHPDVVDTRAYLAPAREAVRVEAARLLELLALR